MNTSCLHRRLWPVSSVGFSILSVLFLLFAMFFLSPLRLQAQDPGRIEQLIAKARSYWGTPHASRAKNGIDCSCLMQKSYAAIGIRLERFSRDQVNQGQEVSRQELRKGDLVFFMVNGRIGHVGMVVSPQGEPVRFIHSSASRGVREDSLDKRFWSDCYVTARRILN